MSGSATSKSIVAIIASAVSARKEVFLFGFMTKYEPLCINVIFLRISVNASLSFGNTLDGSNAGWSLFKRHSFFAEGSA